MRGSPCRTPTLTPSRRRAALTTAPWKDQRAYKDRACEASAAYRDKYVHAHSTKCRANPPLRKLDKLRADMVDGRALELKKQEQRCVLPYIAFAFSDLAATLQRQEGEICCPEGPPAARMHTASPAQASSGAMQAHQSQAGAQIP